MRNLNENRNRHVDRILTQKKLDVEEPPRKTSRPSRENIPELYRELDEMIRRVEILTVSSLYNAETQEVDFGKATSEDLVELISKDPEVMVPFFVMITGLSHMELKRRGLRGVYSLRRAGNREAICRPGEEHPGASA